MYEVLPVKRLFMSSSLLLFAFPLFAGGIFEIEGLAGPQKLAFALALSLGAQLAVLGAGYVGIPRNGGVGFFRAIAFLFFSVETVALPIAIYALMYGEFHHVDLLDSSQLLWALGKGISALSLLLFSAKTWKLSLRRG